MSALKNVMLVLLCVWMEAALGSVSLSGTRLVFDGRFNQASIEVRNRGGREVLLQVWLKNGQQNDDAAVDEALPFVVTPHLVQLAAQGREQLRLLYQGVGMPEDRESLLHLYVLEIPRRAEGAQQLNIAVRQRINVFYRPPGLAGDPALAPESLLWERSDRQSLRLRNPTPFYAALQDVRLDGIQLSDYLLLAPGAGHDWPLKAASRTAPLSFKALTDYGGQRGYCARLHESAAVSARLLPAAALQSLQHDKEEC